MQVPPWAPNTTLLMVPDIPSRMLSSTHNRNVNVAKVRSFQNQKEYKTTSFHPVTMWCCGPHHGSQACPLKACTVGPDSHVATVFYLAGCLSNIHATYETPHRRANYADPVCTLPGVSRGITCENLLN